MLLKSSKVVLNPLGDTFRAARPESAYKPFDRVYSRFGVIAPADTMTQWNNVIWRSRASLAQRNPVVCCESVPQSAWPTADSTAPAEIIQRSYPVVLSEAVRQFSFGGASALLLDSACRRVLAFRLPRRLSTLLYICVSIAFLLCLNALWCGNYFAGMRGVSGVLLAPYFVSIEPVSLSAFFYNFGLPAFVVGMVALLTSCAHTILAKLSRVEVFSRGREFLFAFRAALYGIISHGITSTKVVHTSPTISSSVGTRHLYPVLYRKFKLSAGGLASC